MEEHKHSGHSCTSCSSGCFAEGWCGKRFILLRILIAVLLVTFVFLAGMAAGSFSNEFGGGHRNRMRGGWGGESMMGGNYQYIVPMMTGTTPVAAPATPVKK